MRNPPILESRGVSARFGHAKKLAVGPCDLQVGRGELVAIVGPSGSGKTTLIQILAGLIRPATGVTMLLGEELQRPSARIAVVFQDYGLFPWRTALDNVCYPLEVAGLPRQTRHARATAALRLVNLEDSADKYPHQLSGGMAQRTAIARAVVGEPHVLLLDEPMSALDVVVKQALQEQIRELLRRLGIAAVIVTHDLNDAVRMADRVVVLAGRPGRVVAEHISTGHQDAEAQVAYLRGILLTAARREAEPAQRAVMSSWQGSRE